MCAYTQEHTCIHTSTQMCGHMHTQAHIRVHICTGTHVCTHETNTHVHLAYAHTAIPRAEWWSRQPFWVVPAGSQDVL